MRLLQQFYLGWFILMIILLGGCFSSKDCLCPEYYSPVCGDNNKTYDSPCLAECDDVDYVDGECPVYGIGKVIYYDTTQNGCGYLIEVFNRKYKPYQLPIEYQIHELIITMKYRRLNDYQTCEIPPGHFQVIQILEIQSYQ